MLWLLLIPPLPLLSPGILRFWGRFYISCSPTKILLRNSCLVWLLLYSHCPLVLLSLVCLIIPNSKRIRLGLSFWSWLIPIPEILFLCWSLILSPLLISKLWELLLFIHNWFSSKSPLLIITLLKIKNILDYHCICRSKVTKIIVWLFWLLLYILLLRWPFLFWKSSSHLRILFILTFLLFLFLSNFLLKFQ